ncbi:MAG: hypothetical protein Q9218_002087 [Villophora microphyllina]
MDTSCTLQPVGFVKTLIERISNLGSDLKTDGMLQPEIQKKLQDLTKELTFAVESPRDALGRLAFVVREMRSPYGLPVRGQADEAALLATPARRLGLLSQIDQHHWAATPLSNICVAPTTKAGLKFMFDFMGPVFHKMPESLGKRSYHSPTATQGPLQDTYNTKLAGYDLIMEPQWADTMKDINLFMEGRRQGTVSWLKFYPFAENVLHNADVSDESVAVVDVGGGLGHGLIEIKETVPDIHGRLILQDLPNTVQQAGDGKGVFEPMAHDFFTPQPVKGTIEVLLETNVCEDNICAGPRAFLIRQVLHDWPDAECRKILEHLAVAMRTGYSKLLINEYIVPEVGASDFMVSIDLIMMGLSVSLKAALSPLLYRLAFGDVANV